MKRIDQPLKHQERHAACEEHCPTHGPYTAVYALVGGRWVGGHCPRCLEADKERQRREERARQREHRALVMLKRAGVPRRYRSADFESFEPVTEHARRIRDCCRRYAETFPSRLEAGTNLVLSGAVGNGKTHLACAIVRDVIQRHGYQALYTSSVSDAVRQVRRTYDPDSDKSESEILDYLGGVPLLVLDEVGVQTGSEHERMVLFEIFNRRYADMRPTILISNLGYQDLTRTLGERVIDRLLEDGTAFEFNWDSYRRSHATESCAATNNARASAS
ncbi:ATP-binding protein [Halorhodospira halophila]|uniref:ATP-binding protein n=1 Tax=Halorhodospira halophila TaxID=1053 RepID=UPI00191305AA|nr:ATP-binding protein [Halorhodospira halophila]MBK5944814.1 hypothetical protein [Halorhodospira halophila]